MEKVYKNMYLVQKDVYNLAGPHVFSNLSRDKQGEKNAIILTSELAKELAEPDKRYTGVGGIHALKRLNDLESRACEDYTVFDFSPGLDILVHYGEEKKAREIKEKTKGIAQNFKVITRDPYELINCRHHNVDSEKPEFLLANSKIIEKGIHEGTDELLAKLYENDSSLEKERAAEYLQHDPEEIYMNQFIRFRTKKGNIYARATADIQKNNEGTRILGAENERLELLKENEYEKRLSVGGHKRQEILGIRPLDMEQYLISQYGILNPDVEVAFIAGGAGSGKTLLSYVMGVDQILNYDREITKKRNMTNNKKEIYEKMILLKPNDPMGGKDRNLGFLPGDLWEKLETHLTPFRDAHKMTTLDEVINFKGMFLDSRRENKYGEKRQSPKINKEAYLPTKEPIELISSAHLRGVSFQDAIVLVDEAQNFTPYEMKTLISRGGNNTKFVIMGDPSQFDNPLCSPDLNGFTASIQFLLPKIQSALVKLPASYRSQTAEDILEMPVYSN